MRPHPQKRFFRFLGLRYFFLKPLNLFYLLLIVVIAFILYHLVLSESWSIKKINCTINQESCPSELTLKFEDLKGQKLLIFKPSQVKDKLLKSNPDFENVEFQIYYPDKLDVKITTKQNLIKLNLIKYLAPTPIPLPTPISTDAAVLPPPHSFLDHLASLQNQPFESYYLDSQGNLLTTTAINTNHTAFLLVELDLPKITQLQNFYLLYHELYLSDFRSAIFWGYNSDAGLKLNTGAMVIFSLDKDPRQSVASLQQIRSESTINFDQSIIDLRFTNPVISTINQLEN